LSENERKEPYQSQTGIVGLGEDGVLGFEDELGEQNLVLAFVDLLSIRVPHSLLR